MTDDRYVPHIDLLMASLRITRDRLHSRSKIAIPAGLLKKLLTEVARAQTFDEAFYRHMYPDLASAHDTGQVKDLHAHFIEAGWLEGGLGADPGVDEVLYLRENQDVRQAVASGTVASATDHYLRSGAAEGRVTRAGVAEDVARWRGAME